MRKMIRSNPDARFSIRLKHDVPEKMPEQR